MKHIKQLDIAKRLGVTRITISKALRNHPDISSEMKDKVKKTADELGYIPNLVARNLISRKTFTVGLVIPDLENNFFAYATNSIIDTAAEKNFTVFVTVSRENQQSELLNIRNLMGMRVDGLLVCVTQNSRDENIFNEIEKMNIPYIFFDRQLEGRDSKSVVFSDYNGAVTAVDKIAAEGYSKIAHFAGYTNISIGKMRKDGYISALVKNGLEIKKEWIIEGGYEVNDGYQAFKKLLELKKLPEIILAVNDRVALGIYRAAQEAGIKIPDDIGIVAYGFNETAQTFTPALSVINQDPRRIGKLAVELLIEKIENADSNMVKQISIEEEFIWNRSIKRKKH
jgi:LacI family transcriptional regulator